MKATEWKQKLTPFIQKLKADKKIVIFMAAGILGMLLLLLSEVLPSKSDTTRTKEGAADLSSAVSQQDTYLQEVEKKLTDIITSISGAGRAKVMVTLENSSESVWAARQKTAQEQESAASTGGGGKEKYSSEDEYIIIKSNGSDEDGLLVKVIQPKIRGVAVVCDGGDSVYVREKITNAVAAVLDISTAKIAITKMATEN